VQRNRQPAVPRNRPRRIEEDCVCGVAGAVVGLRMVLRYLTFEYLPRADTKLALTDIEAQHPTATTTG